MSWLRRSSRSASSDQARRLFLSKLSSPYTTADVLTALLEAWAQMVRADALYAYTNAPSDATYRLRVTRVTAGTPTVGPNYAGLVSGIPTRPVPLTLRVEDPAPFWSEPDGDDLAFHWRVGSRVVVRALLFAPDGREEPLIRPLAVELGPVLDLALFLDDGRADHTVGSLRSAVREQSMELALGTDRAFGLAARLMASTLNSAEGLAWLTETGAPRVLWQRGEKLRLSDAFRRTLAPIPGPSVLAGPELPRMIAEAGFRTAVWFPLEQDDSSGGLVLAHYDALGNPRMSSLLPRFQEMLREVVAGRHLARAADEAYIKTLVLMADLLDLSDPYNERHHPYAASLAGRLAETLRLPPADVEALALAGRIHDIGMAVLSPELYREVGVLAEAERAIIREHPVVGSEMLEALPEHVVSPIARAAIRHHHERFDGLGYPDGLAGTAIPLGARILAAVEQLLGRLSNRSYRSGLPIGRALATLQQIAGTELDPEVVEALLNLYRSQGVEPDAPGAT